MTTAPAIPATPTFAVRGEWTPGAISALASILIAHARREIEAERAAAGDAGRAADHDHQTKEVLTNDH